MGGEKEESAQVTFKLPQKYLLWSALLLGGGGTTWNKIENTLSSAQSEQTDRAMYETLAKKLGEALARVDACEGRLDALEKNGAVRNGRGGALGTGSGRGSGAGVGVAGRFPSSADGSSVDADGVADLPESAQQPLVPSYDMVKQLAAIRAQGEDAAAAAPVEDPDASH